MRYEYYALDQQARYAMNRVNEAYTDTERAHWLALALTCWELLNRMVENRFNGWKFVAV